MRAIDLVRRLCPRARSEYVAAFESGDRALTDAGISTPKRLAHFLAQAFHETDGLTIAVENGSYTPRRMMEVWPSRFPTIESAQPYAHDPVKLFNKVYGNRMGNGGPETGDGYRYRGRGILQTTGREAYRRYGKRCGADFEADPDLILSAEWALAPALAEWVDGNCNAKADAGDIRSITRTINGGFTGLADRQGWLRRIEAVIADLPVTARVPPGAPLPAPAPISPQSGAAVKPPPVSRAPEAATGAVAVAVGSAAQMAGFDLSMVAGLAAAIVVVGLVVTFIVRARS